MAPSIEEIRKLLVPWRFVRLTSRRTVSFHREGGYVGDSFEDSFEFKEVINIQPG